MLNRGRHSTTFRAGSTDRKFSRRRKDHRAEDDDELRALVDRGIARIRMTSRRLDTGTLHGTYGKRELLQAIYTVYVDWRDDGCSDQAWDELANRLPDGTIDPSEHLLGLLIRVALPEVRKYVVAIWVDAILYGEVHHVRPHKLRSFFHVKEGLVRCAQLQRQSRSGRPLKKRR